VLIYGEDIIFFQYVIPYVLNVCLSCMFIIPSIGRLYASIWIKEYNTWTRYVFHIIYNIL